MITSSSVDLCLSILDLLLTILELLDGALVLDTFDDVFLSFVSVEIKQNNYLKIELPKVYHWEVIIDSFSMICKITFKGMLGRCSSSFVRCSLILQMLN